MTPFVIITGGIGSGKSVVTRILNVLGLPTYDCDSQAKRLINTDPLLREQLTGLLGAQTYAGGTYDTDYVSRRIFDNKNLLDAVNAIVHPAVISDIHKWAGTAGFPCFVETALARQSGLLQAGCRQVWHVKAPDNVRITRVERRSGLSARQIQERINAQRDALKTFDNEVTLLNDNRHAILPQVMRAIEQLTDISNPKIISTTHHA